MKKIALSFDSNTMVQTLVSEIFALHGVEHVEQVDGAVIIGSPLSKEVLQTIEKQLNAYGIQIIEKETEDLVEGIKRILRRFVDSNELRSKKVSSILSDELGYSYSYLSNFFSKATYTSVENFLILLKIEKAKKLLTVKKLNLTEVAHLLDYSSVAHLSSQFKNITGLTVSQFLKLAASRKIKQP